MANTSVSSSIRVGMQTDTSAYNLEKGQYNFLLNGTISNPFGNQVLVQNDSSNYLAVNFPEGFKVIGKEVVTELNLTLFFITNPDTGLSQIGVVYKCRFVDSNDSASYGICEDCTGKNNKEVTPLEDITQTPYCTYTTLIQSDCLNFSMDYPVDIEYRIVNNSLYIYFTDGLNKIRYIYFDIENGQLVVQDKFKVITGYTSGDCPQPIYGDAIDCNKLLYNPNFEVTEVFNVEDVYGGTLPAGVYQVMISYADSLSNPLTSYFAATDPYPLRTRDITIETNYNTHKALSFEIKDLDQSGVFQFYNIVIAQTVDNFTDFYLVATLPVTTTRFTYTGANQVIRKLTEDDVFFQYGIYQSAGSVTKANDYLFFANLKTYPRLNLQQAVARIAAYWQTIAIDEVELRKARNVSKYRGCLRDEVYPYGIVFEFTDNNDSLVYPLIGPASSEYSSSIMDIVTNDDVIDPDECFDLDRNKYWQVYNTGTVEATPHEITGDCDEDVAWEWGKFAYWESTETYPNVPEVWGDLCGTPIRHFKYPDSLVTHFHDGLGADNTYGTHNIIYPIGIRIDHQSVIDAIAWAVTNNYITQAEADTIKGYRIVRGNRYGNKSIQSKGLMFDMWNYTRDSKEYFYPNFPYNDLTDNIFLAPDSSTYDGDNDSPPVTTPFDKTGRYTYHSPDTHFTNSSLGTEIKLETDEYGESEGYFNNCNGQPKYKLLSTAARTLCFAAGVASAISHITKECRQIEKAALYTDASLTGGISNWKTVEPVFRYNTTDFPRPIVLPAHNVITDCKGTTYQWLNPAMIAGLFGENNTEAFIMTVVVGLAGVGTEALYFLSDMLSEISIFTKLLQALTPAKNYFIQYNSVGTYNNYLTIGNTGNKIRALDYVTYLDTNLEYVDELTGNIVVNNRDRESSVMFRTDSNSSLLPDPVVEDDSRVTMDSAGIESLNERFNRTISSYYASLKNYVPNQYGSIYSISYLETGPHSFNIADAQTSTTIFGGDTFISRFALKIKHPFFTQTRFQQLDNADVSYSELGNAAFPNYYLDYGEGILEKLSTFNIGDIFGNIGAFFQDLVGTDDSRLDAKQEKFFYQQGFVHLYNYGIPYFLVESDVNVDFRHGENNTDKDYYPHASNLDFWLQEENVPIQRDNTYFYNTTYSKQNHESVLQGIQPNTKFGEDSIINDSNLLVYSQKANTLLEGDNWKILRPENVYRLNSFYGAVVSIDGIESDKVLIRAENGSQIFAAYNTLQTSGEQIQISTGSLFESRPKEFAITNLGYMGCQHRDILNTEFGHIFVDAKRGNVFNLQANAQGLDELTKNGMSNWFRNNLPFFMLEHFPELTLTDVDNSYKGLGISMSFDRSFNRFFLTKLDYLPKNDSIEYSPSLKQFSVDSTIIELGDPTYFYDKSWTISYNFMTQTWTSFHSFKPNYYLDFIDYFQSGVNGTQSSLWSHGVSNKSYQVYYGQLYPFIVDVPTEFTAQNNNLNSISYITDVIRYQNEYDSFFKSTVTFNKAIVYNNNQNSGQLVLIPRSTDDMHDVVPKITKDGREIAVTNSEGIWNFNEFFDTVKSQYNNIPIWSYDRSNVNKELNKDALNYYKSDLDQPLVRGRICNTRLINDEHSNYHFIFLLTNFNSTESIR